MTGVLALNYRPLTFDDVVGQAHVKQVLRAVASSGRVPPSLIFSGSQGTGKTTCARIFAAALNCENPREGDACGVCSHCVAVQKTNSSSVLEVDAATSGGVEQVRTIKDACHFAHDGDWRVVILDEAHSMSKEAYTALLKTLEEPPPNTVFILVTTEPEKILGTVRSRSMPFEFRRIKTADLVDRLRYIAHRESLAVDDALLLEISKTAQGGLRDAVMLLDQITLVGVSDVEGFRSFFGIQDYSLPLMWAALRGDHAEGYRLVTEYFSRTGDAGGMVSDLSRLVSELLVVKSEGRPANYGEESLSERVEMAQAVETEGLVRVCEILWELRSRVRATENDQHSSMEMGFALIANSVKSASGIVVEPSQPILTTTSEEKLSLAEISDFTSGR